MPVMEVKFDQVLSVAMSLFSETLMLLVKVAFNASDGSWMT